MVNQSPISNIILAQGSSTASFHVISGQYANKIQDPNMNTMLEPDPSSWTVDEVIKFFCVSTRPEWAPMPPRDPTVIEESLSANNISGHTLLNFVDNTVLRDDLKIRVFGDRAFIIIGIKWLQQRSLAYLSQITQSGDQNTSLSITSSVPLQGAKTMKPPRRVRPTLVTEEVPFQLGSHNFEAILTENDALCARILRLHPPKPDDDPDVMPDSDSDVSDDIGRKEDPIEEATDSAPMYKIVAASEVSSELDAYIQAHWAKWKEHRLPQLQQSASSLWETRESALLKEALSGETAHLQNRLMDLLKAVHRADHTSQSSVRQACGSLDNTLTDLFSFEWKMEIINGSEPPDEVQPPILQKHTSNKPRQNCDDNETLGSEISELEDEEHQMDDMISGIERPEIGPRSPLQNGPFQLVYPDEALQALERYNEEVGFSEGHVFKRPRNDMEMDPVAFDPDIPLPSRELDELFVPMSKTQNAEKQGSSEPYDYLCVFDRAFPMMWSTIEKRGKREHLLAKSLLTLSKERIDELSFYLGHFMEPVYREEIEDALTAMNEDKFVVEGSHPELNHQKMMLASLFVSWLHCTQLSEYGIPTDQVQTALQEIQAEPQADDEDDQSNKFAIFWTSLDALVTAYPKWKALATSAPIESPAGKPTTGGRRRKRKIAKGPLSNAQKQAQKRQAEQDGAKLACSRIPIADVTRKAVSFKNPIIYLDSHIGRYIKPHQLDGIRFMFREIVENKSSEGCLLAHTMGLGKTMQV
jgi:hypothetical protein